MGSLYSAAFSHFPPDWRQCRIDGVRCGHNTMVSAARWRVARQHPAHSFGSSRVTPNLALIFQLRVTGRKACGPHGSQENV